MSNLNTNELKTQVQNKIDSLNLASISQESLISFIKTGQAVGANITALESELATRLDNVNASDSLTDIALLSVATNLVTQNRTIYVDNVGELPNISAPGTVYYVSQAKKHYVKKQNNTWTPIDIRPTNNFPLYGWGDNTQRQLGNSYIVTNTSSPVPVQDQSQDWIQIDSKIADHNLAIKYDGTLWAWGRNDLGQCGTGDNTSYKETPILVANTFTDWIQASVGGLVSGGVRSNGSIWMWGLNTSGQLGDNTTISRNSPVSVFTQFNDWTTIATGGFHTLGLRANGTLWAWGRNDNSQLGDSTTQNRSQPIQEFRAFSNWTKISAGQNHSLAIRTDGTLWSWGLGSNGRLGNNDTVNNTIATQIAGTWTIWTELSAGQSHSTGILSNGLLLSWGENINGKLGDNTTANRSSPVIAVGGITSWSGVSAGTNHTVALTADGKTYTWGQNTDGRLGNITTTNRSSPTLVQGVRDGWTQVSAGVTHTLASRVN